MSFMDNYRARLNSDGGSIQGSFVKDKKVFIADSLPDSPNYYIVKLNGEDVGARVNSGDSKVTRWMTFMPDTKLSLGSLVEYDDMTWMITDGVFDSDVHPKANCYMCNENMRWIDSNGDYHDFPAVLSFKTSIYSFGFNERNDYFPLPEGQIRLYTQRNETTKSIQLGQRFIFGEETVFKVDGKDDFSENYGDYGIINMVATIDEKVDTDDFENGIADNSHIIVTPPDEDDEDDSGGGWW